MWWEKDRNKELELVQLKKIPFVPDFWKLKLMYFIQVAFYSIIRIRPNTATSTVLMNAWTVSRPFS